MRLRQILLNLLSNACKFTKQGEVKLKARKVANGGNWIELAVSDTASVWRRSSWRDFLLNSPRPIRSLHGNSAAPAWALHYPQARAQDGSRRDGDERARQRFDLYGASAGWHGNALTKFHKPFQPRPVTQCPLWVKERHDGPGDSPPRAPRRPRVGVPLWGGRRRWWRLRWPRGRRLWWLWRQHRATLRRRETCPSYTHRALFGIAATFLMRADHAAR